MATLTYNKADLIARLEAAKAASIKEQTRIHEGNHDRALTQLVAEVDAAEARLRKFGKAPFRLYLNSNNGYYDPDFKPSTTQWDSALKALTLSTDEVIRVSDKAADGFLRLI